jgi:hypothetical protein
MRRWWVIASLFWGLPIFLAGILNGIAALPYAIAIGLVPFGYLLISGSRPYPAAGAIALTSSAAIAVAIFRYFDPLLVPSVLNGCVAPLCGALGVAGLGQAWADRSKRTLLRPVVAHALVVLIALATQAALVAGEAQDSPFSPLSAFVAAALFVGVPYLCIAAIFGRFQEGRLSLGFIAATSLLCLWTMVFFAQLLTQPHLSLTPIVVQSYRLRIAFDEKQDRFIAQEWMAAELGWADTGDLVRDPAGKLRPLAEQPAIRESLRLLRAFGVDDFTIDKTGSSPIGDTYQVRMNLSRTSTLGTSNSGLFAKIAQFELPAVLGLTPAIKSKTDANSIQLEVETPEHFGLKYNLDGSLQDTVLASGEPGKIVHATRVNDLWGVIRLRYSIRALRNPVFSSLAELNGWGVVVALLGFVSAVLGYLFAVVLDVIKDSRLKPAATRILTKLKIIPKNTQAPSKPWKAAKR